MICATLLRRVFEKSVTSLRVAHDVSPADWIVAGVRDFEFDVGSLVPVGFEAYGRVFHPAYRNVATAQEAGQDELQVAGTSPAGDLQISFQREVGWSEVAAANGRTAHAAMDWISITGSWRFLHSDTQPPLWEQEPSEGSLPLRQIRRMIRVLAGHTMTPEACWFALWDGFGDFEPPRPNPPRVQMPHRPMYLFTGSLDAWIVRQEADFWERSPSLWWPNDRAWCVATDVDLMSTYVGGSEACIDALVRDEDLEAFPVTVDQKISCEQDTINPAPADPPAALKD